ncbi:MAG TPA: hypothetical protein ENL41_01280 [candidate division WOR-3 bacterium]|uniref:Uncharacterized protein n=1 Tax=candidate division WOR-3 bacterium TaxID=2052148 RepID=A0A7C5MBI0_UNCW3|nr:hypothetical protein [candidate division WOR-3 bacterium]
MRKSFIIAFLLLLLLFPVAYLSSIVTSLASKVARLKNQREIVRREMLIKRAKMVEVSRLEKLLSGRNGVEN